MQHRPQFSEPSRRGHVPVAMAPKRSPDDRGPNDHRLYQVMAAMAETGAVATLRVEPRTALDPQGLIPGSLVVVRRGIVLRQRSVHNGAPIAIDIVGAGAAFTVAACDNAGSAMALDNALCCVVPQPQLEELARSGECRQVQQLLFGYAYRLERYSEARGRTSVRARVAATLCTLSDTLNPLGDHPERLPGALLQRDLAALASTRHESVCRVLRRLSEEGLVHHGPSGIEVTDYAGLAAI